MSVFSQMAAAGHEQVCHISDAATGLRAIVAMHSSVLGPGLGGVRIRAYEDEQAALVDVLRLSEAMSYKAACAGLRCGGAKAVVLAPFPRDREAGMHALGRAIDGLAGRYVATEDMGMSESDIALLNEVTPHAVGRSLEAGGSGDPSPHTADGVIAGMRAALRAAERPIEFAGLRVAVQGCGHVGLAIVERLIAAGAEVIASDIDDQACEGAAAAGAQIVDNDRIHAESVDIFAPSGVGAILDESRIAELKCAIVAGAANNQLATPEDGMRLAERGIVYAPDYVINAGGLINVSDELDSEGYNAERVRFRVASIETTLDEIFEQAKAQRRPPESVALDMAKKRIEAGER
ncbi:Leucine dehydrogenase Ldh protein [Salinisphaera shabanensis E1L3A]|uniref:Leucine dehydrogenase Ldh protein n=1 Tax=Salinisphaera shabanensis E1L3A TaxID=1033802 RepID=U2EMX0_9GAMM|nr:Glu/Leu/Phe/Val dehydrogenase dimerization domain-containing protein [Salinisphaera shabanensis]ERJ19502.1 Leucine dehydrogenase Ldh protein [Salinisphaera shabanensis E1L3A]